MTEALGVSDILEASLLGPEKTVTEAKSSFNLCFVALNDTFLVPTVGPCCPTLGPHLDLRIMGPTVGQNKALHWVHNKIFSF